MARKNIFKGLSTEKLFEKLDDKNWNHFDDEYIVQAFRAKGKIVLPRLIQEFNEAKGLKFYIVSLILNEFNFHERDIVFIEFLKKYCENSVKKEDSYSRKKRLIEDRVPSNQMIVCLGGINNSRELLLELLKIEIDNNLYPRESIIISLNKTGYFYKYKEASKVVFDIENTQETKKRNFPLLHKLDKKIRNFDEINNKHIENAMVNFFTQCCLHNISSLHIINYAYKNLWGTYKFYGRMGDSGGWSMSVKGPRQGKIVMDCHHRFAPMIGFWYAGYAENRGGQWLVTHWELRGRS